MEKGVLFLIPVLSVAIAKQVQAASLYYSVAVHQEPVHTAPATLLPFLCPFSFPVQSDPCRLWQDPFSAHTGVLLISHDKFLRRHQYIQVFLPLRTALRQCIWHAYTANRASIFSNSHCRCPHCCWCHRRNPVIMIAHEQHNAFYCFRCQTSPAAKQPVPFPAPSAGCPYKMILLFFICRYTHRV